MALYAALARAVRALDRLWRRRHPAPLVPEFEQIEAPAYRCDVCGTEVGPAGCEACALDLRELILEHRATRLGGAA